MSQTIRTAGDEFGSDGSVAWVLPWPRPESAPFKPKGAFKLRQQTPFSACFILLAAGAALVLSQPDAHGHGAYHEELQRVNEQLAQHPDAPELLFKRAWVNYLHGDWQSSLVDLERTDRIAPGEWPTDFMRGQALMAAGRLEAAKAALDAFLEEQPRHGEGLLARGRVLWKMERSEAALTDLRAALECTAHPEPDLFIEVAEALKEQRLLDEAAQVLADGVKKLGNSPGLVLKALDLELATGRFDAALTRIDAMQKLSPRPEPWMARRASVLAQAGRVEASRAAWITLRDHLATLPNLERGSHAMSLLARQTMEALSSLDSVKSSPVSSPTP